MEESLGSVHTEKMKKEKRTCSSPIHKDKHPLDVCSDVLPESRPPQIEVTSLDSGSNIPQCTPGSLMCSDVLPESRPPQLEVISLGRYSDLPSQVAIEFGPAAENCSWPGCRATANSSKEDHMQTLVT